MGPPVSLPPGGHGHGPFGAKAFRGALAGCVVIVVAGALMGLAGGAVASAGVALVVLGIVGLVTTGGLLLLERLTGRRP